MREKSLRVEPEDITFEEQNIVRNWMSNVITIQLNNRYMKTDKCNVFLNDSFACWESDIMQRYFV